MPSRFHTVCKFPILLGYVAICWLMVQNLVAQPQNPFDIHSRQLLDSVNISKTSPLKSPGDADKETGTKKTSPTATYPTSSIPELIRDVGKSPDMENESADTSARSESNPVFSGEKSDLISPATREKAESRSTPLPPHQVNVSWWHYIFDLILLLLLLGAFLYDKKIFSPLRKAFVHENFLRFLYRDTYLRKPGVFLYLNIIFLLSLGFILYRISQYYGHATSLRDYLIIQGIVLFLFAVKHLALQLLSKLVDKPFEVRFYRYWMILSAGIIGLWMIPVTLMVSVLPAQFLFIALLICSIPILILLIYRQIKAMVQAKFFFYKHFFHFFLYFCAVEIVPVILLTDILVNN